MSNGLATVLTIKPITVAIKNSFYMEVKINNSKRKGRIKYFLYIFLILMCFEGIAQANFSVDNAVFNSIAIPVYKEISFGEKIDFGEIENTSSWTINSTQENMGISLTGSQINDYIFKKPGIYEISFFENKVHNKGECNHPPFQEKMIVKVSPYQMKFDFSTIKFSESIVGGKELLNAEVSVEVDFESYNYQKATFSNPRLSVVGLGAAIVGSATNNKIILTSGRHKIVYQLNGIASKETYIMFDFFDIKNQIQCYYYPTKI